MANSRSSPLVLYEVTTFSRSTLNPPWLTITGTVMSTCRECLILDPFWVCFYELIISLKYVLSSLFCVFLLDMNKTPN